MSLLVAGTAVGVVVTLVAGQEPGGLLGFFIIVGAIAAALCIKRGKVYLLFPAPALAFFVAAIVTGKVHDAKLGSSTASLGAGFTQWVAGIFFPAVVGTIIVVLIGGGRWLLGRQLVTGQSPLAASRPAPVKPRPAPRDRRPAVDSWAEENPFDTSAPRPSQTGPAPRQGTGPAPRQGTGPAPRQGTGPAPRQGTGPAPKQGNAPRPGGAANGARPPRPARDPRGDRDQWGAPSPADGNQPGANPRPRPRPNGQPRPQRPSWNPAGNQPQQQQRPQRRQPPDGWPQR
jgi:hypothetical protein